MTTDGTSLPIATLDYAVLIAYLVILVGIGMWVSYRRRDSNDLFLGDKSFGWANVGLSIWGTNVGPSFLIGSCGAAYATGMVTANFEWYAWVFLMLMAMVFLPHYASTRITTMPQFVRRRFGEAAYDLLAVYALISTVLIWLAGTLYAGGLLLGQLMGWSTVFSIILLMVIAASFTALGGLAAVIVTDSFQVILMIIGTTILGIIGFHEVGGLSGLLDKVPAEHWQLLRSASDKEYPWPAILLGYPVLGVWFWCTDQTVVQRALGARNLRQGQLGALFAGYLKILPPLLFMLPGLFCLVLHPGLESPDDAFLTMVSHHLPAGMSGLIIAVLVAALISTVDSGLNSFSTIFTLDIYKKYFKPEASGRSIRWTGQIVTVGAAVMAVLLAVSMQDVGKNLFDLLQSLIAYVAPPMAALFLVGILWRRATAASAVAVLTVGSALSLGLGYCQMKGIPVLFIKEWPHFLLYAFYMFVFLVALMVVVSLATKNSPQEEALPKLRESYRSQGDVHPGRIWLLWGVLAVIMLFVYVGFQALAQSGN